MNRHIIYRVITLILLPVAALFGICTLMVILAALVNPAILLPAFITGCVVLYIFTSFSFLNKGILQARPCKPSLKDWIKVNAYVAIVFAVVTIFQSATSLSQPQMMSKALDEAIAMQPGSQRVSKEMIVQVATGIMYFLLAFSVLLMVHILITFRLLKQYRYVFEPSPNDPQ